MTREEAQEALLKIVEKEILEHGEDDIAVMSPMLGKNSWIWKEYKEAVINDTNLNGTSDVNPINMYIEFDKWRKEHNHE